jgi:predicted metalloprotease
MIQRTPSVARAILAGLLLFESVAAQEPSLPATRQQPEAASNTSVQTRGPEDSATQSTARGVIVPSRDRTKDFISAVLGDTEDVWDELFRTMGLRPYPKPKVVLVSRWAISACGRIEVASAPYYCAAESRFYLDPASLGDLPSRSGDFAAAFVIAREIGHHVQSVLSTMRHLDNATTRTQEQQAQMRARLELQADCYAGVWTYFVNKRGLLEPQELEEGSAAALKVGDTSTNSEYAVERLRWFRQGLVTGDPRSCDIPGLPTAFSNQRP